MLNSKSWLDPARLPLLLLFLCFQDTIVFLLRLFFFLEHFFFFFEGPLLMQFPVILLAHSLNLKWLRWSRLGLVPTPWLSSVWHQWALCKQLLPENSSGLWQLLHAPFKSLCTHTVRVICLCPVEIRMKNKRDGEEGDKKFSRKKRKWWRANLPADWTVWQVMKIFALLLVYKKTLSRDLLL